MAKKKVVTKKKNFGGLGRGLVLNEESVCSNGVICDRLNTVLPFFNQSMSCVVDAVVKSNAHKGFHDFDSSVEVHQAKIQRIALMHGELSKCLESLRSEEMEESEKVMYMSRETEKMAALVIRVMDYCGVYDINLPCAIIDSVKFGLDREYMHGGKLF